MADDQPQTPQTWEEWGKYLNENRAKYGFYPPYDLHALGKWIESTFVEDQRIGPVAKKAIENIPADLHGRLALFLLSRM